MQWDVAVVVAHMADGWMPTALTMCVSIRKSSTDRKGNIVHSWMHSMLKRREMQENSQKVLHIHLTEFLNYLLSLN